MTDKEVSNSLARDIHTTEEALDDLLGLMGGFFARLIQARRDANLSAVVGHEVYESVNQSAGHIMSARKLLIDAHRRLEALGRRLHLEPTTTPVDKPPPSSDLTAFTPPALTSR